MRQIPKYREEVNRLLAELEGQENINPENESNMPPPQENREPEGQEPEEVYDLWTIPTRSGKRGFIALPADDEDIIYDSTLVTEPDIEIPHGPTVQTSPQDAPQGSLPDDKTSRQAGLLTMSFFIFLCLACLAVQIHFIINPPVATITIIPKSQTVSFNASLQLGRVLSPITLSQSATTQATGRGHQDAKQATGFITFYNASFSSQAVNAGTVLTGADGVQVVIDETVTVPPNNPPQDGQASIAAHAINAGSAGNIQASDINGMFSSTLYVKNLSSFTGGQDERNFQFVTQSDIENAAIPLKASLAQSVTAALQTQLKENEQFQALPCTPHVSADHTINEEAAQVKVTATLTCSGVAYNENTLQQQATQLLATRAFQKLGSGYSEFGTIQVIVNRTILTHTTPTLVLSLQGVWTYALSEREQQRIKHLIAGNTKDAALQILRSLPGIERVSIAWDENTKLPKDSRDIHLVLITGI